MTSCADAAYLTINGRKVEVKPLYPKNGHLARQYLTKYDPDQNKHVPWTDPTSITVALCSDKEGTTVIPGTGMGPNAMTAVEATDFPGWWHYVFPTSVTELLDTAAYRDQVIYQRVIAGALAELRVVTPFVVRVPRFAT